MIDEVEIFDRALTASELQAIYNAGGAGKCKTPTQQPTTTHVSSSENPSTYGDTVSFAAAVSPSSATGTVQFKIDGNDFGAPAPVVNGTAASGSTSSLSAGAHTVTAVYGGDTNYTTSTGALTQTVNKADARCTVTGYSTTYDGGAHAATGSCVGVSGEGLSGLDLSGTTHTNAGDYPNDPWTFTDGTGNYNNTSGAVHDRIGKAASTVVVSCPASVAYTGAAQTPCTASVTGAGGLNQSLAVSYSNNVNVGTAQASATFAGDANHEGGGDSRTFAITLPLQFPQSGAFVIGDRANLAVGATVYFWGSQWAQNNPMSGGEAPNSFKGFEDGTQPSGCGSGAWSSRPGNSSNPPATLPQYMAVIVSGSVRKDGPAITGDVKRIVVVRTDAGYGASPGHAGTGRIVAIYCPGQSAELSYPLAAPPRPSLAAFLPRLWPPAGVGISSRGGDAL
jgi:hypothetical protein